ncbi:MAG: rane-bound metal-dependent hydrolase [Bryobacterales bacterium]|nr:rane-bound metal-dependent hydrolase [Bryobacterales bacterium]
MDNVTHTLVGLMLSRAGLNRGEKGTPLMLMLAANAPDMDTYPFFTDSLTYLQVHRSYPHSFAFAPLVALVPLLLVKLFTRTRVTGVTLATYGGCLVAVLSHLLLDWTNVYGVRFLLPFDAKWYRLDTTNIIDPVILGLLLASLAMPALIGLVSSEIAGRKSAGPKRGWAWFALVALLVYDAGRWMAHEHAISLIDAHYYKGAPARRISVVPDNLGFRWRGIVEGEGFVYEVPVSLMGDFDPAGGHTDYPAISSPAIDAARTTRTFQVFENFDQLPFWSLLPVDDTVRVELLDLRFGSVRNPRFEAVAFVEPDNRVARAYVTFSGAR